MIRGLIATGLTGALFLASAGLTFADTLQNELDVGTADTTLDSINVPLTGGSTVVDVWLDATNEPSDTNCNLDGADSASFSVTSSDSAVATFSPASFSLTACGSSNSIPLTVTSVGQGTANALFTFNSGGSTVDSGEVFVANTGNFTVIVDDAPAVSATSPADNATGLPANSNITITFSEAVNITSSTAWYSISCSLSGSHTAATSGSGTASVTLNPGTDFTAGESCSVGVNKNHVEDADVVDGLNGLLDNYSFDFSIASANGAPTVDAGGPYSGNEGSPISISGTASDPDSDPLTYVWSLDTTGMDVGGDCVIANVVLLSTTVTCDDDSNGAALTLTLTVNGDPDGPASDTANFTVNNVAPTVSLAAGNAVSVTESASAVTYTYTRSDVSANDVLTSNPDCGTAGSLGTVTGSSFECTFLDGGAAPAGTDTDVTVYVTDDEAVSNTSSTATQTVNIANANPVVAAPSFSATTVCQGSQATLTGIGFSDAGTIDNPWSISIDWGDGSLDYAASVGSQGGQSNVSPTYNTPGTYTATVTVTDKDGGSGSNTSSNQVSVVAHYSIRFLQPVDGTTTGTVTNSVKLGRVVPVKILIWDNCTNDFAGGYVTDPATLVRLRAALAPTAGGSLLDSVETYADAGQANSNTLLFRWTADASAPGGGFWIYNLDTKNANQPQFELNKTYRIDATIGGVLASGSDSQYALLKMAK